MQADDEPSQQPILPPRSRGVSIVSDQSGQPSFEGRALAGGL
jgi:hypothetical protein